jgi:hypothetical protein
MASILPVWQGLVRQNTSFLRRLLTAKIPANSTENYRSQL